MKFVIFERVEVINHDARFNGKIGKVVEVNTTIDVEPVYTIIYEGSNNKGMFAESKLKPA